MTKEKPVSLKTLAHQLPNGLMHCCTNVFKDLRSFHSSIKLWNKGTLKLRNTAPKWHEFLERSRVEMTFVNVRIPHCFSSLRLLLLVLPGTRTVKLCNLSYLNGDLNSRLFFVRISNCNTKSKLKVSCSDHKQVLQGSYVWSKSHALDAI